MGWGILMLVILSVISLFVSSSGWDFSGQMFNNNLDSSQVQWWRIMLDIRAPRTLGTLMAGALLGLSGALAQGLFRNPLADPYLLGSASGASLGVAILLASLASSAGPSTYDLNHAWWVNIGLTGAAFIGSTLAMLLTLFLARGVQHTLRLLLAGIVVGVLLGALTSLMTLRTPSIVQIMQVFMLGSTALLDWSSALMMLLTWVVVVSITWAFAPILDGLVLGEATALSLGLPLRSARLILIVSFSLACASVVAHTGLIAFVGLAAPHLVRAIISAKHAALIFLSSLMGALLLLLADILTRGLFAPEELPVGILTAILGGGYLLYLLHRRNTS